MIRPAVLFSAVTGYVYMFYLQQPQRPLLSRLHHLKINRIMIRIARMMASTIRAGSAIKIRIAVAAPTSRPNVKVSRAARKARMMFKQKSDERRSRSGRAAAAAAAASAAERAAASAAEAHVEHVLLLVLV